MSRKVDEHELRIEAARSQFHAALPEAEVLMAQADTDPLGYMVALADLDREMQRLVAAGHFADHAMHRSGGQHLMSAACTQAMTEVLIERYGSQPELILGILVQGVTWRAVEELHPTEREASR